jgi:hypothetical protein
MSLPFLSTVLLAAMAQAAPPAGPAAGATEPRVATFVVERRADGVVGSAAAMMHARLAVVGNCVLVRTERGEEVVPVFGAGTASWDSRARRLSYRGRHYAIGDVVPIGGGGINPAMIPQILRSPSVDLPSDCPLSRLWFSPG